MSVPMTASQDSPPDTAQPATTAATRPLYWSIRRELWENRVVYLAPLIIAACVLAGVLFRLLGLPDRMAAAGALDPVTQHLTVIRPFHLAPAPITFTYCDRAYERMTDTGGAETVQFMGHDTPKLGMLTTNNVHAMEHYGNLVTYMRMKNVVPPTSEPGFMKTPQSK